MKALKVGIIGTGMALEKLHYPAFQELADKYTIVALCDINPDKARYWANVIGLEDKDVYKDYRKMLERKDIDVYDIMVPIPLNYKITEEVARAIAGTGKGIICEKPTAASLKEARAHSELPRKYSVPIMIAENYRYNDQTNIIRDMIRLKEIGDPLFFIQVRVLDFPQEMFEDKFPAKEWRQYPDYPGGAFFDSGVHDLAALRHILGAVEKLNAFGRPQDFSFSPYSVVHTNITFKSGVTGQFSFYCAGKESHRPFIGLRIFGTEGMIYLEERDSGIINISYNDGSKKEVPYTPQRGYYNELLNFYNAMNNLEPLSITPEIAFGDTKMVLDILRSIEENTVITEVDKEVSRVTV